MRYNHILNLTVGYEEEECRDGWGGDSWRDVVVLYCNGEEVWRDKEGQYFDTHGDGGTDMDDIAIDMLRKVFSAA